MEISREDLYGRSDRIAVGFCSVQFETDAVIPCQLIVAKENRGAIVGGQQDVQIAVAIEISYAVFCLKKKNGFLCLIRLLTTQLRTTSTSHNLRPSCAYLCTRLI